MTKWWHGERKTVEYESLGKREGGRSEQIAEGITLDLPALARFKHVDIDGHPYLVEMDLSMTPEGVRPVGVRIAAPDGSPHITGTTLRAVRVWELALEAIRLGLDRVGGKATMLGRDRAEELRAQGPVPETLQWVAFFYNLGSALGLPPARQVELGLGVPRTTASKWVRRAREEGLISNG